jgi:hypothetical protein
MGQKMVCFEALRGTRSRQDESIEGRAGTTAAESHARRSPRGKGIALPGEGGGGLRRFRTCAWLFKKVCCSIPSRKPERRFFWKRAKRKAGRRYSNWIHNGSF